MLTTLSTRTSVLGVTNPTGPFKLEGHVSDCTKMSGPLLSRFDIVLLLLDSHDSQWDELVSQQVLANHQMVRTGESTRARGCCVGVGVAAGGT